MDYRTAQQGRAPEEEGSGQLEGGQLSILFRSLATEKYVSTGAARPGERLEFSIRLHNTGFRAVQIHLRAPITPQQTITGALTTSDTVSPQNIARYADFFRLTVSATTAVTIDLKSRVFDTDLYLLSSSGAALRRP